ncbi:diaminopimelate decarboxylase [Epidermidibacterium keratini]|uniref:Diaminopimelate decarboxylase n=1 Tax=Epidermidibacterium keratini TaxID=1891644 RepID=A0A7L4YSB8_9ACTN|nr:diaminopimelate decarboxylase [Epidermidibacterium keratini]QHC01689.1 diaminopimelate decarboxylase [Epidermidibacterium keratini]
MVRAHPAGPLHGGLQIPDGIGAEPADVNALDARVWPSGAHREDGVLVIGKVPVTELAREFGTPVFAFDEADFRARARDFQASFDGMDVFYAGKSFLSSHVVRWLDEDGLGLDVCSGGELALALRSGFPAKRIAFHGNNKSYAELQAAVDAGVGRVVVDSMVEISRLDEIAAAAGKVQSVLVRVTVGVEAHTHEFIATAHEDQKFGFSLANGQAVEAVREVVDAPSLQLVGLHSHIGSQIFDTSGFEVAAHRVVELAAQIRDEYGVEVDELDLGGGMGISYVSDDDPPVAKDLASSLREIVERECAAVGLRVPRISVEPGRAISGPPAVTVYEVGTVKPVQVDRGAGRLYVSVDGGMSDNIRTALYDAEYTCVLASRESAAQPVPARIVGKHCESGDIVVRDLWLPGDVQPGDLLAVAATGAYCRAMASNYNLLGRPPVVGVRDGACTVMVRRETIDDLLALDAGLAQQSDETKGGSQ